MKTIHEITRAIKHFVILVTVATVAFCAGGLFRERQVRQLLIERNLASYNSKTAAFELMRLAEVANHPDVLLPLPVPDVLPEPTASKPVTPSKRKVANH